MASHLPKRGKKEAVLAVLEAMDENVRTFMKELWALRPAVWQQIAHTPFMENLRKMMLCRSQEATALLYSFWNW